jgi:exo-beta-1,3-glucanase (GH17 family)
MTLEPSPSNDLTPASSRRLMAAGKFFQIRGQEETFHLHGICYGPFAPNSRGLAFPEPERLSADLKQIASLGFNTVRLYELPDETVLKAANEQHLRLICGIPWTDHIDFLDQPADFQRARDQIASAAATLGQDPTVAAILMWPSLSRARAADLRSETHRLSRLQHCPPL